MKSPKEMTDEELEKEYWRTAGEEEIIRRKERRHREIAEEQFKRLKEKSEDNDRWANKKPCIIRYDKIIYD